VSVTVAPRPATRWVVLPSFERLCAERDGFAAPASSAPAAAAASELPTLLARDLRRGHVNLAIRHFLMARACGSGVPPGLQRDCEALLRACPSTRRRRIARDVENWVRMVGA
jgi:hypothetical protein